MAELVHLEVADAVATVTLDSEHNRNALSRQLVTELAERLERADADADVRVILVRSAHRVFCSGADLSEAASGGMEEGARAIVALQRQIATAGTPVVVELAGPVRAGGLGIVGAADVVVAAESVTFALTEVRLALAPAVISLTLLERFSDRAAAELFLTGRTFDAAEAQAAGLVTRAVPDADLADAVGSVLADLVQGYPQGLRETKRLLNHDLVARIDALGADVAEQSARLFGSDEAREAMTAFLQRRKS
ncbi:enoyl-CoA hydratase-related protein [Aeromicrobium sp.]|uniref:enoyl-CoA hydratase-related protein n=1 Tax=Aeromicrobium sp. TaxID=1871063 RepID=UPI004034C7BD